MAIGRGQKAVSKWIVSKFDFPSCVGCMDGTLNPLTFEPQCQDTSDYSGRKNGYSLSTLVVNDDKQGSHITWLDGQEAHMTIIFKNSHLSQDFNSYFSEHEHLFEDLAFECFPFIVGAYKWAGGQAIDCVEQISNNALASPHVSSEHTVGMWKGTFPWCTPYCMKIT